MKDLQGRPNAQKRLLHLRQCKMDELHPAVFAVFKIVKDAGVEDEHWENGTT